jgi:hypothetical protein
MQTFLPYPNFLASAKLLDKRRCFKQVVEAKQILDILQNKSSGWKNHPIVKMWNDYDGALIEYYNTFYEYCKSNHKIKFQKMQFIYGPIFFNKPQWVGNEKFHYSHRANLLRKATETNNKELLDNLRKNGITVDNHNILTSYLWF